MKYKWENSLDNLGKYRNQFQLVFPEEDTIHIYRHNLNKSRYNIIKKYTLLMPSFKIVVYNIDIMGGGTYQLEKMIKNAKDEEYLLQRIMVELI